MKNWKIGVCLSLLLMTSSCFTNRMVADGSVKSFRVGNIELILRTVAQNNTMDNGYYYVQSITPGDKGKFYEVMVDLVNHSDVREKINLKNLYLCDKAKNCLELFKTRKSPVFPNENPMIRIKPGKSTTRKLFYINKQSFVPHILVDKVSEASVTFDYKK